jgi:hypothetical protein
LECLCWMSHERLNTKNNWNVFNEELDKPKKIKFDFEKVLKSKCDASLSMQHQLVEEKLIASRKASFQRKYHYFCSIAL